MTKGWHSLSLSHSHSSGWDGLHLLSPSRHTLLPLRLVRDSVRSNHAWSLVRRWQSRLVRSPTRDSRWKLDKEENVAAPEKPGHPEVSTEKGRGSRQPARILGTGPKGRLKTSLCGYLNEKWQTGQGVAHLPSTCLGGMWLPSRGS